MTELLAILSTLDLSWFTTIASILNSLGLLWPVVHTALYVAFFLWWFWVLYVATMGVYRLKLAGELEAATTSRFTRALSYSLVLVAVIVDVIAQYTVASAVFLEWPKVKFAMRTFSRWGINFRIPVLTGEHLVTDRLQRYMALDRPTWRTFKADWVCQHILDLFDPTKNHCNRRSLT